VLTAWLGGSALMDAFMGVDDIGPIAEVDSREI
jgi:hypothetical protein